MMTGSSWALPPRRVKQNICTIPISKKALEDGTLQLNANSGALKHEGISQKDWTERILSTLSAEYADGGIQSQEPLKNITDKNGNVVYTDVADMLTPILEIPYAPEGYDSLLDYMNSTSSKTRNFKGNLNDAFEQLDNARDLFYQLDRSCSDTG